jgi:uncharacterized membrane-anchored protein
VRKVPEITAGFWLAKLLVTALGESVSDYGVHRLGAVEAVLCGFVVFAVVVPFQLARAKFVTWSYWASVTAVAIFGTMVADVTHVRFGVPFGTSTALFAVVLAGVFAAWYLSERTLSIHTVDSTRRELFYWATVTSTFALGTALGDMTATTLHLGYFGAGALFAGALCVVLAAWRLRPTAPVLGFWTAYVLTRPLGASIADWLGKPRPVSGLGNGDGPVAGGFALAAVVVVACLTLAQRRRAAAEES